MSVIDSLNIPVGIDAKGVHSGARATKKELTSLGSEAKRIWNETRTPQELYQRRLQNLAEHVRQGTIDQETFARAVRDASLALEHQGAAGGRGVGQSTEALDIYRSKLEELAGGLAAGRVTESEFAAEAKSAAEALGQSAAAAGHAGGAVGRAAGGTRDFDLRVRHLEAALHSGRINFDEFSRGVHEAREAMERAERSAARMERVLDLGRTALATFGITLTVDAAFESIKGVIEEGEAAEASMGRLEAIVRATGGASGKSAGEMRELAHSLEKTTNASYLQIEQVEAIVATQREIDPENFKRVIEASLDMGTVFGSTESAAKELAAALSDPERRLDGLARNGITFSASEKALVVDLVAAGRAAEAQAVILDHVEHSMGGAAKGAQTLGDQLSHTWGTAKRSVYEFFAKLPGKAQTLYYGHELLEKKEPGEAPTHARPADLETKAHRDAKAAIAEVVKALREEASGLKQTSTEAAIAKAEAAGLTAAELSEARAAQAQVAAHKELVKHLSDEKKLTDSLVSSAKQLLDQQESANRNFGKDSEGARLDAQAAAIDEKLAMLRDFARGAAQSQAHGGTLDDYSQQKLDEYNELKRARNDIDKARVNLDQRREKETDKTESDALAAELKSLHQGTRTPKEEIEAEMAELKALYDRTKDAGKFTEDRKADFLRKRDELREKYDALDKKPESKAEHQETPALLAGSAEAFHAVARFQNPSQAVEKQSLAQLREINRTLHEQRRQQRRQQRPQVIRVL